MTIGQPMLRPLTDDELRGRIVVRTNHGQLDGSAFWTTLSRALEENFLPAREIVFGKSREVEAPFSRILLIGPAANASKKYPIEHAPVAWRDLLPEAKIDVASSDWDDGTGETYSYFGYGVWVNDGSHQPIGAFEVRRDENDASPSPIVSRGRSRDAAAWLRAQTGVCFSLVGNGAPAGPARTWPNDASRAVFFFGKLYDHKEPEFYALETDADGKAAAPARRRFHIDPIDWWEKDGDDDWHHVMADGRPLFQFRSRPDVSPSRLLLERPRNQAYLEVVGLLLPWPSLNDVQRVWVDWTSRGNLWTKALFAQRWSLVCDAPRPAIARVFDRDTSIARVFDRDTRRPKPRGPDQCYHVGGRRIQLRPFDPEESSGEDRKLQLKDVSGKPLGFIALSPPAGGSREWRVASGFDASSDSISLHWLDLAAHVVTQGMAKMAERRTFGLAEKALEDREIKLRLHGDKIEVEDMRYDDGNRPQIRERPLSKDFSLGPLIVRAMPAREA